jgi:F-box/WD-40 domain protein 10
VFFSVLADNYENESISSSTYSFHSETHPELDLLSRTRSEYSLIDKNPFEGSNTSVTKSSSSRARLKDSEEESLYSDLSSVDPTCMIIPTSAKAYSGVARHMDFIRHLPVHLSKYILGMLDESMLNTCAKVSSYWKLLAEEVHKEFHVNQLLKEEVMLMQVSH